MKKNVFMLKFETSKKIQGETALLLRKVALQLDKEKYQIIQWNENMIIFDDYKDRLSKIRGLNSKLYEGHFEVLKDSDSKQVKLVYFMPYGMFLTFFLAIILISIFSDISDLIMCLVLVVFFIIEIFNQKSISKKLIDEVCS